MNNKPVALIDMDGTIADYDLGMRLALEKMLGPGEEIPEDPYLLAALTPYNDQVEAKLSEVISEAEGFFDNENIRKEEAALGNLVADAMLWATKGQGSDFAIQNGGGIRAGIPEGDIDIGIEQVSYVTGSLIIGLQQSSYDPIDNRIWRLIVMLNGIDISASITGSWRVDAREGSARIAEFSMMPALGAIDPTDWVRQPVTLDYAAVDILGTIQWQRRLFTGIVDVPEYDPTTRITRFACTDRLQERLEQSNSDEVDSLIGGY